MQGAHARQIQITGGLVTPKLCVIHIFAPSIKISALVNDIFFKVAMLSWIDLPFSDHIAF